MKIIGLVVAIAVTLIAIPTVEAATTTIRYAQWEGRPVTLVVNERVARLEMEIESIEIAARAGEKLRQQVELFGQKSKRETTELVKNKVHLFFTGAPTKSKPETNSRENTIIVSLNFGYTVKVANDKSLIVVVGD